jgi:hypothetical protein
MYKSKSSVAVACFLPCGAKDLSALLYKLRPQNEQTMGCNFSVASARNTFVEPVFNNV